MPKIVTRHGAHRGYLNIEAVQFRLDDGSLIEREIESHGEAVAVLPYDPARRCALLVRLFRAPVFTSTGEDAIIEACAGMIDDETAEVAARREAVEELGVELDQLELVARVWSSPGVSTERQTLFLAKYTAANRTGPGGGVAAEHEGIAVIERSLNDLADDLERGVMVDGKLVTLLLALRLRQPGLFDRREA